MTDLRYSDGIAAARTMIALKGNGSALQRRLPSAWELAPYAGDDLRGTSLRGANMLVAFHEVYAVRTHDGQLAGLPPVSYIAFVSQAREQATGTLDGLTCVRCMCLEDSTVDLYRTRGADGLETEREGVLR
jgi:hypothetical protein